MYRHLAVPLAIARLAASVNLSPSRFRALFMAQIGLPPAVYLRRLRLRRARLLIERTFLSETAVMGLVGYSDPSHFARDFRRQHGASPSAFRGDGLVTPMPAGPPSARDPLGPVRVNVLNDPTLVSSVRPRPRGHLGR
jgi:transcriptional regulator GlxA family with amidase domain